MRKILALDQASRITGYAIFEDAKLIKYGKFFIEDDDIGIRLMKIRDNVLKLINEYEINEVVFEDIQLQNNVMNNIQTFKTLAEVFGVIYELVTELNLPHAAILASSWKSTLGIKGRTRPEQKRNAQEYVIKAYDVKPTQDECDAICIGLHYLIKGSQQEKLENYDWSD